MINADYIQPLRDNRLFVFWLMGNFCPYKCSYCDDEFNDGKHDYHPKDDIFRIINKLPPCHVMFSGGEPTYHPNFEVILKEKPANSIISVISNGARPIGFWERAVPNLFSIILTFHTEYAQLERFSETALLCKPKLQRINLTMIPELWDKCIQAYDVLTEKGLPVTPKPLVSDFGFKSASLITGYSKEQLDWISSKNSSTGIKNIGFYKKDGTLLRTTNATEMLANNETNFNGWECYTNLKTMYVNPNGDIFSTSCKQRQLLGTITTDFQFPTEPITCRQNFCWCHSDIQPKKVKL